MDIDVPEGQQGTHLVPLVRRLRETRALSDDSQHCFKAESSPELSCMGAPVLAVAHALRRSRL